MEAKIHVEFVCKVLGEGVKDQIDTFDRSGNKLICDVEVCYGFLRALGQYHRNQEYEDVEDDENQLVWYQKELKGFHRQKKEKFRIGFLEWYFNRSGFRSVCRSIRRSVIKRGSDRERI